MDIRILHMTDGAKQAEGTAVIIDVFRAFTWEAVMFDRGAAVIYPTASIEESWRLKEEFPDAVIAGERNGVKVEGFDFGNAPSELETLDMTGRTVIHTTSAGTQGIILAEKADEILTGALINAAATAEYIRRKNPAVVSLVAMGWKGERDSEEDVLCAEYLKSLLEGQPIPDIRRQALDLRYTEGKKFFDPAQQAVFPRADFDSCVAVDRCPFAITVAMENGRLTARKQVME
ncbi:MAG: 2-phosphosulfolactate phosphatase [Solobacterium sp.]|nr:2-phosphosulfolactate phosphatase [Solobacterium sp.]